MSGPHFQIVAAAALTSATRAEIIALCHAAYAGDFARLFDELPDSVHVLARDDDGTLVSHAEWVTRWLQPAGHPPLRTAYVEAVATVPRRQRCGLATSVLRYAVDALQRDPSWEIAALSPSDPAFYARLGWELWRGPLGIRRDGVVEPTPSDERVMIYRLSGTPPALAATSLLTAEWRVGELW